MLVEKGAKLSAKNKDGFSVLDAASKKGKFKITATSVVNKLVYIIKSINIFEISSKSDAEKWFGNQQILYLCEKQKIFHSIFLK